MEEIKFSKLNGQGNDFIIIDATVNRIKLSSSQITEMCNRNFGIGADGLILVGTSKISDLKMEYYNRDGSVAEMCGNGIRCMARFAYENNLINSNNISIETLAGIKKIFLDIENNKVGNIKAGIGSPEFRPGNIPVKIKNKYEIFNYKITVDSRNFYINCISLGNPHCVIFMEEKENLDTFPVNKWGPRLENHNIFPNKTNVEFIQINSDEELTMRVWERGVGETLSCGTGACAAGVCAIRLKKIKREKITVNMPGGKVTVSWDFPDSEVYLEGKVDYSFEGQYLL